MWPHDVTLVIETANEVHISAGQDFSFSCDPPCEKKFWISQGLLAHKKRLNACKAGKENNCPEQGIAYRIGLLSNAEISDFSPSRRVSRVEPPISNVFDKLREG